MKPLNRRRLRQYVQQHPDAELSLRGWWNVVQQADWRQFSDIRQTFNTASYVDPFTVFNIKGNTYRLVTYVDFEIGTVVLKWFGSHSEYDKGQWK